MKTKYCPRCTVPQPVEFFNKNSARNDGLQTYCRVHQGEYDREYYQKNTERRNKTRDSGALRRQRNAKHVFAYLSENSCMDCGESDPVVLQFDHAANVEKDKNVCDMVRQGLGLKRIQSEIDKCEVRCANCHARKTAKDFGYYSYQMSNNE